ncbi:MAG: hypothetical protein NVS1B14_04530 [Vulcanimicrobiaceae bacterium]
MSAPDPAREAAERELRRIVTIGSDIAKYRNAGTIAIGTAPWQTSVPRSMGTPVPLTVSAVRLPGPPFASGVSVRYPAGAATAVLSRSIPLTQKAPAPGDELLAPGLYPDPNRP